MTELKNIKICYMRVIHIISKIKNIEIRALIFMILLLFITNIIFYYDNAHDLY